MIASAIVGTGPPAGAAELDAAIADAKVTFGLDAEVIAKCAASLADPAFAGGCVVARGDPPVPGKDGYFEALEPGKILPGATRADGSIDYRERHFLVPVADGAEIGRMYPPTAGTPGRNVLGASVPAKPGKALALRCGAGARCEADRVLAARAGVLLRDGRQVDVVTLYTHASDVDYESGSLHTDGSLEVRGDVGEGFAVAAKGDVHVAGSVLNGTVEAAGSVRIDQGVLGEHAQVIAASDLHCRHATAATLEAGGVVELGDQAVHCHIRARSLVANSGRGAVFGGETRVQTSIVVRVAGTAGGARTVFVVGDVSEAAAAVVAVGNADAKIAERVHERCDADGKPVGKPARDAQRSADNALESHLRLRVRQRELLADARVEADTMHPGVRVLFGDQEWICDQPRHGVRLRWRSEDETIVEEIIT